MKRIKIFAVAAILCAIAYSGYLAYQEATMSDQERMFLANVEALTRIEDTSGDVDCLLNPIFYQGWTASACAEGICSPRTNTSAPLKEPVYGPCK